MKKLRKVFALLLTTCMVLGCMTVSAFAASEVTTSAFGQSTYPTVSGNYADTVYAKASVDVGDTVTDSGALVLYSSYGLCTVTNWNYAGAPTVTSNNPSVATAEITYSGSTLNVAITGVADGTATITVNYGGQTRVNDNQIHSGTNGTAIGNIKYTVTVGTGTSSGGSTTPDPTPGDGLTVDNQGRYVIYTQADLAAVANDMTASYILANDIALTGNWTPLGWADNNGVAFTGTFDGNGYTISGLYMDYSGTNVGLFAINKGTIKNFSLIIDDIRGTQYVGAVAGLNQGTIENISVTQATSLSGGKGIVGLGTAIEDSYGTYYESSSGGVAGKNSGTIKRCFVDVTVYGYYYVGGIAGENYANIIECAFTGGINTGFSDVTGCGYIGGITGRTNAVVNDCYVYNSALITGEDYVGGAIGRIYSGSTISNVWVDPVKSGVSANTNASYAGRFAGRNNGTVSQSYVVVTSSASGTQGGANKVLVSTLKNQTSFPQKATNWDWDNVWTWSDYPVLRNCGNSGAHEDIVLPSTSTEYTVAFDAISKTGDTVNLPESVTVEEGTVIYLTEPTRTNAANWVYQFQGWTCSADNKTYDVGEAYTVNSDVTFTASWKLISVNGDGKWTYVDAMSIMDYLAGNVSYTDEQLEVADYNNDGKVTYVDAMSIMDVLAGNTPAPPTT